MLLGYSVSDNVRGKESTHYTLLVSSSTRFQYVQNFPPRFLCFRPLLEVSDARLDDDTLRRLFAWFSEWQE